MIPIENLKQQQREICELIHVLTILVQDESVRGTRTVFNLLNRLTEQVEAHFHLEDSALYADLLNHDDKKVKETAWRFLSGEKEIKRFFNAYAAKWCRNFGAVDANGVFQRDTEDMLRLLLERMQQVESEFYPLVGELQATQGAAAS